MTWLMGIQKPIRTLQNFLLFARLFPRPNSPKYFCPATAGSTAPIAAAGPASAATALPIRRRKWPRLLSIRPLTILITGYSLLPLYTAMRIIPRNSSWRHCAVCDLSITTPGTYTPKLCLEPIRRSSRKRDGWPTGSASISSCPTATATQ